MTGVQTCALPILLPPCGCFPQQQLYTQCLLLLNSHKDCRALNDTIDEIKGKRDGCDEPQAKQIEQRRDIDGTAPNSPDDGRECNPAPNVTKSATVT